jgi:transcriptional regulator with XRE-family HTH domain
MRLAVHMTEQETANKAKIAQPFYHNIEAGIKNPSVDTAKRIAGVFGFDWTRFYEDEGMEQENE